MCTLITLTLLLPLILSLAHTSLTSLQLFFIITFLIITYQLWAAIVTSTQANASISAIDSTAALAAPVSIFFVTNTKVVGQSRSLSHNRDTKVILPTSLALKMGSGNSRYLKRERERDTHDGIKIVPFFKWWFVTLNNPPHTKG